MHEREQSCLQNLQERDGLEDKGVGRRITVKLKKYDRGMCTGFIC